MGTTGQLRVSDADRSAVADRLLEAHGEGRLSLAEFDERVRAAHAATVRDDLAPLLADLPARGARGPAPDRRGSSPRPASPAGVPGLPGGACGRGGGQRRAAVATWALVSALNLGIWLAVVLGTGAAVYPWWVWVAGPWGLVLAARTVAGRSSQVRAGVRATR